MYTVTKLTRVVRGYVNVTMDNNKSNAVELAAAWGLYAKHGLKEIYKIQGEKITFTFKRSTFDEWLDIVTSVTEA